MSNHGYHFNNDVLMNMCRISTYYIYISYTFLENHDVTKNVAQPEMIVIGEIIAKMAFVE